MDFQNLDPQKLIPQFQKLLLTFEGRIGRQDFWIGMITIAVVNLVVGGILGWISSFLSWLVMLVLYYPVYCVSLKRSNDLDYPQIYVQVLVAISIAFMFATQAGFLLWVLWPVLLLASVAALVLLGFVQGTNGPNRYGPDPLTMQNA
ncbi:Inner membrane protein YhaI [bacterium YEK0313]|nr:Inner membrane protein YhaI [bacterium YEK0313]